MKIRMGMRDGLLKQPYYSPDRRAPEPVLQLPPSSGSSWGSTTWKRMRLCPREHALYQLGVRSKRRKEALDTGFLFHHALEVYFRKMRELQQALLADGVAPGDDRLHFGLRGECEEAAWQSLEAFVHEAGYEETYPKLQRLLVVYFETYRRTHRWLILAVEETLGYADERFRYTARLDLIVHDVDHDDLRIVEHKTAGYLSEDLLLSYEMDLQILGQIWLLHNCVDLAQLPRWGGVIVDIVTTRNNPPRVHRQHVMPSKYHLQAFEQSMAEWTQVSALWERLDWPKAFGSCAGAARFFKTCSYYSLCHGHPQHTMADWVGEIRLRGVPFGYELVGGHVPTSREDEDEG